MPDTGLSGVSIVLLKSVYLLTTNGASICIFSADCSVHETGLLVYIVCVKIVYTIIQKICRESIAHKHSFNTLGIFVHYSVRAYVGSFQKANSQDFL